MRDIFYELVNGPQPKDQLKMLCDPMLSYPAAMVPYSICRGTCPKYKLPFVRKLNDYCRACTVLREILCLAEMSSSSKNNLFVNTYFSASRKEHKGSTHKKNNTRRNVKYVIIPAQDD